MNVAGASRPPRYNYRSKAKTLVEHNHRFACYLTAEQDTWLSAHSQKTGLSRAHLVRSLINEGMKVTKEDS